MVRKVGTIQLGYYTQLVDSGEFTVKTLKKINTLIIQRAKKLLLIIKMKQQYFMQKKLKGQIKKQLK